GLGGFITNPDDDRGAAVSAMVEKAGGKVHDVHFLRGEYDVAVMTEAPDFEAAAAIKMLVMASGAMDKLDMVEIIDMNSIARKASKMAGAYRAPGSRS
ncbi:MAG: GYD domain-containing protein, partial [Candidatus Puniceispirillales bacterium]